MATNADKQIDIIYNNVKNSLAPPDVMRRIGRAQAARTIDLIRERTDRGRDISDQPFRQHSRLYRRQKSRLVSGAGRISSGRRTAFAAKNVPSFMRLSGQLFSAMHFTALTVRRTDQEIIVSFRIGFKSESMRKRAEYQERQGRFFFGLARPGTTAGRRERKELLDIGKQGLALNARSKGFVLQDDAP